MRTIQHIVIHCTATPQNTTIASILQYWKYKLKWKKPGYHYIIKPDGTTLRLLPIEQTSNGVKGHNQHSIHIAYIGGINQKGNPIDNRTQEQKNRLYQLTKKFKTQYPNADIRGHRDFLGVTKKCPSFDVQKWWKNNET